MESNKNKMICMGCKHWPLSSQESTLTGEPSRPVAEQATKCTNKPYPFVKNIYYIMSVYSMHSIQTLPKHVATIPREIFCTWWLAVASGPSPVPLCTNYKLSMPSMTWPRLRQLSTIHYTQKDRIIRTTATWCAFVDVECSRARLQWLPRSRFFVESNPSDGTYQHDMPTMTWQNVSQLMAPTSSATRNNYITLQFFQTSQLTQHIEYINSLWVMAITEECLKLRFKSTSRTDCPFTKDFGIHDISMPL